MKKILMALPLLLILFTARAQKEKNLNISDTSQKNITLNEITLAANRFPEKIRNIAQQVYVIGEKKIKSMNQPTPAEMLMQTGQVLVQKSQLGGGSPVIRGFEANKVLLVVDGIRMNNAIYRGGHLQNVITLDNESMSSVEILMGPSSVMYGSDALGGVMSFFTKSPERAGPNEKFNISGTANIRHATAYREGHLHADLNMGWEKMASFTSITFSRFGDLQQGRNKYAAYPSWGFVPFIASQINGRDTMLPNPNPDKQTPTGYDQYDFLQKFIYTGGKITHGFNIQYSTSGNVPRIDRLSEISSTGILKNAEWYYGPQKRFLAAWTMELPESRLYDQSKIISSYQAIEESRHNRSFGSSTLKHRTEHVKVYAWNADFRKKANKTEISYGAEFTYNTVHSSAFAENITNGSRGALDTRYPDGGSKVMSSAGYATVIQKFKSKWIAQGGFRLTDYRLTARFDDTTFFPFPYRNITQQSFSPTGHLGIVYLPGNNWKISILLSAGFRNPNVDDLAKVFESISGRLIVPNPGIKPEKTLNHEIGISKWIGEKIHINTTAWYTRYENVLTTDSGKLNGQSIINYDGSPSQVFTTVNKNKAYIWGISSNLTADINDYLSFQGAINYTYGSIRNPAGDYPLDHIPPVYGKAGLTFKKGKYSGEMFCLFNGAKDSSRYNLRGEDNQIYSADPVRGYTPAWYTLNLRNSYEFSSKLSIMISVENILDRFYRVFSSGLSGPGRNFVIAVRTKL